MTAHDRMAGVVELSRWIDGQRRAQGPGLADASGEVSAARLEESIGHDTARDIVIRSLGRKGSSRHELSRLLSQRGVDEHVATSVLDGLEADRLLDDDEFARDLAERLRMRGRLGERGIAAELLRRGLDPGVLEEADEGDEVARATEAAADRRRRSSGPYDATVERRLAGFLQRRGFSGSAIRKAIEATRPSGPRFR